ncbi:MAG: MFS transporter [Deltaproteobacteria bacterium]|nr:MFS transporter [Deltaproteobacteria bacterium]
MDNQAAPNGAGDKGQGEGLDLRLPVMSVIFLTVVFFLNFISRVVLSPLMPSVEADLGLGHGAVGSFFLFMTAGHFVSLVGSGFISSRITHCSTIILSLVTVGSVMVLVSLAGSAHTIALGMFLLGLATGFYLPSGIAAITDLVHPSRWGKALAIHEFAPNMAFLMAPIVAEALLVFFSWRGVMAAIGIVALLVGIFFSRVFRAGDFYGQRPDLRSALALFRNPSFLIITALFSLGIGSTTGVYSMLPLYLVAEHGIGRVEANTLIAISRFLTLGTIFLGGWAADHFGKMRTIRIVFFITGITTILLGVVPAPWLKAVVLLQPLCSVCFFPAGFAVLSAIVPPASRHIAISMSIPIAFLVGAGIFPTGIGLMGDAGMFGTGFIVIGALIFTGCILPRFVRLKDE